MLEKMLSRLRYDNKMSALRVSSSDLDIRLHCERVHSAHPFPFIERRDVGSLIRYDMNYTGLLFLAFTCKCFTYRKTYSFRKVKLSMYFTKCYIYKLRTLKGIKPGCYIAEVFRLLLHSKLRVQDANYRTYGEYYYEYYYGYLE